MAYGIVFLIGLVSFGYSAEQVLNPLAGVRRSHIQGNVPVEFDQVLKRDLTTYFQELNKDVLTVQYELLRNTPSQVGVGSPKYYIWVKIYGQKGMIDEGAVKVAAEAKKLFIVLTFEAIADLKKSPEQIDRIFPLSVGDKIRSRLK